MSFSFSTVKFKSLFPAEGKNVNFQAVLTCIIHVHYLFPLHEIKDLKTQHF